MAQGNHSVHYKGQDNGNYKHGMSGTKFYICWKHINARCNNPNSIDYPHYGGRGIKNLWDSFEDFYKDMFDSYVAGMTIERINVNSHYCKKNCRWATRAEQSRNTRRTNLITFNGETKCLVDWAKQIGIKRATLSNRINIYGWSIDKALTTVVKH